MRDSIKDHGRIEHMLEMAYNLRDASTLHSYEEVISNRILFFGLTKMTEIIGEAAYKLTREYISTHTELPWKEIIGMRHMLVHGYFKISPEELWDVIQIDIPAMIPILEKYKAEFEDPSSGDHETP